MRRLKVLATALAAVALAACANPGGKRPKPAAEGAFSVIEQDEGHLTVDAAGRRIQIAPPEGYCVDPASIRDESTTLFVMIGKCDPARTPTEFSTLSLGDKALFGKDKAASLEELASFIETDAGRVGAGMGGKAEEIRILDTKRSDDTLFVLVEDTGERVVDALGERFWRAFTEVNGRAAIVTHGVAGEKADRDETMLRHLTRIVDSIKKATREARGEQTLKPAPKPAGQA